MDIIRNIKYFFINLKWYYKILIADRDYDDTYLYEILRVKLRKLRHSIHKYSLAENKDVMVKKIDFCIRCLDRLIKDDYRPEIYDLYVKIYGTPVVETKNHGNKFIEIISLHGDKTTPEMYAAEDAFIHNMHKCQESDRDRDIRLLFRVIEKYVQNWWY